MCQDPGESGPSRARESTSEPSSPPCILTISPGETRTARPCICAPARDSTGCASTFQGFGPSNPFHKYGNVFFWQKPSWFFVCLRVLAVKDTQTHHEDTKTRR